MTQGGLGRLMFLSLAAGNSHTDSVTDWQERPGKSEPVDFKALSPRSLKIQVTEVFLYSCDLHRNPSQL